MPPDLVARLDDCSKAFAEAFEAGRRHLFARTFLGRRWTADELEWQTCALRRVSLDVRAGEKLSVVGPRGAGKTVLAMMLAGTIRPSAGRATIVRPAGYFSRPVGFAPPLMTLREFVRFASVIGGHGGRIDPARRRQVLTRCGLANEARTYVRDVGRDALLSIGLELMRSSRIDVAVLDEPSDEVLAAFWERPDFETLTLVVLSRNPRGALERFDRLVVLSAGRLLHDGPWRTGLDVHEQAASDAAERRRPSLEPEVAQAIAGADDLDGGDDAGAGLPVL
jgi:lipopolysaccharide transport system ATP-binding protein